MWGSAHTTPSRTVTLRAELNRAPPAAQINPREFDLPTLARAAGVLAHPEGTLPAHQDEGVAAGQQYPHARVQGGNHWSLVMRIRQATP